MACSNDEACRTCDGRCCSVFTYTTDLKDIADRFAAGESPDTLTEDYDLLLLLRPLTHEEAIERAVRFGVSGNYGESIRGRGKPPQNGYYTCRAWDEESGLCTIYDSRPNMCRGYPYGRACDHGCSYEVDDETLVETHYMTPKDWFEKSYS